MDLGFLSAVTKIKNDLERVGDEAVNIAYRLLTQLSGFIITRTKSFTVALRTRH
ncbi:hypothetical protein ACFL9U_05810 [Thermodesulfobacteriota bacterium]